MADVAVINNPNSTLRQQLALQQANAGDVSAMAPPPTIAALTPPQAPSLPSIVPRGTSLPIRGTTTGDQLLLNDLEQKGSGVSQIKNPLLHAVAATADTLGTIFLPHIARFSPGSTLNHEAQVAEQEQRVQKDRANAQQDAQLAGTQASTRIENDHANALEHPAPAPAEYDYVDGPNGKVAIRKGTTQYTPVTDSTGTPLAPKKTVPTNEFEAWQAQNPTAPVSNYFELKAANAPDKQNKDDKAIAIMSKPPELRSPDENAYLKGYDQYVQKNKIAPAAVRVNAMMQMPQAIVDPNDPSREIFTTRAGAVGKEAPGSGDAAAARSMDKYMTSGAGGQSLNAFNTAQTHLDVLAQAASALHNHNTVLFNKLSQQYAQATGSAAPTNFDAVKLAVRGEVAKALAGHSTVAEQHDLDGNFDRASSPDQLAGIATTYRSLLEGKKQALRSQYTSGVQGLPDFGGSPAGPPVEEYTRVNGKLVKK